MPDPDISSMSLREHVFASLPSILVDSIVLDNDFRIVSISQNILDLLEFSINEVREKNFNYLSASSNLRDDIEAASRSGYFRERTLILTGKSGSRHRLNVSGFHLGLVNELTGYILLKIARPDGTKVAVEELQKAAIEIDRFIYRTAHDLRGPLATIKGLIHLIRIRENDDDIDRFAILLEAHANLLDERLFQLVYVAQSDHMPGATNPLIDFVAIETTLRKTIEQNAFVDFLDFTYSAPADEIIHLDQALLTGLFNNLLLYILSLTMTSVHVSVAFDVRVEDDALLIVVKAQGFRTSASVHAAVQENESFYTHMIQYPHLVNFYAARKIALQLRTAINVQFEEPDTQYIRISVPLGEASYSK